MARVLRGVVRVPPVGHFKVSPTPYTASRQGREQPTDPFPKYHEQKELGKRAGNWLQRLCSLGRAFDLRCAAMQCCRGCHRDGQSDDGGKTRQALSAIACMFGGILQRLGINGTTISCGSAPDDGGRYQFSWEQISSSSALDDSSHLHLWRSPMKALTWHVSIFGLLRPRRASQIAFWILD